MNINAIIIAPTSLLVKKLTDYYSKGKSFDTSSLTEAHGVGYIVATGEKFDQSVINKIIYFNERASTIIQTSEKEEYYLVSENTRLLIRMDQDKYNY